MEPIVTSFANFEAHVWNEIGFPLCRGKKAVSVKSINVQYPLLMASRIDKWGWRLPYSDYFGGVGTISAKQFEQV